MLNRTGHKEGGLPCYVPELKENVFNISSLSVMFTKVFFIYISFIMLRKLPFIVSETLLSVETEQRQFYRKNYKNK